MCTSLTNTIKPTNSSTTSAVAAATSISIFTINYKNLFHLLWSCCVWCGSSSVLMGRDYC